MRQTRCDLALRNAVSRESSPELNQ